MRLAAVVAGGALCGVAGAYLSVVYAPLWVEGLVAGRGWIALALTTFATWRPLRVLLGAYLFGGVTMLQFALQGEGVNVASQLLAMLPYLATIVVLVLICAQPGVDTHQHAGVAGQALLPRLIIQAWPGRAPSTPDPSLSPTPPGEPRMTDLSKRSPAAAGPASPPWPPPRRWSAAARRRSRQPTAAAPAASAAAPKPEPLKIAFVYVGPVGDGGWTFAHDNGRKALEAEFGDKIATTFVEKVPEAADAERVIRDLAARATRSSSPPPSATWSRCSRWRPTSRT